MSEENGGVTAPVQPTVSHDVEREFYSSLYDVLVLCGIPSVLAAKTNRSHVITDGDAKEFNAMARKLIEETKCKLASISKMTITPRGERQ